MSPEDSLDIISKMMSQTRQSVLRQSYWPFLTWGWTTICVGMTVYLLLVFDGAHEWNLLWLLLPVIGFILVSARKKHPENRIKTALTDPLKSIWLMLTSLLVSFSVCSYLVSFNILFFILLLLAIGCYVTGAVIKYPLLQYSSIAGFLIAASLWIVTGPQQLPFFLLAIVAMMIIPGYKMKQDLKYERA